MATLEKHLYDSLDHAGFLENDRYREMKAQREKEFAEDPLRESIFAGAAYPDDATSLRESVASSHWTLPAETGKR